MLSVPNGTTPSTLELCGVVFERVLNKDCYNLCVHQKKEQPVVIDKHALSEWYEVK